MRTKLFALCIAFIFLAAQTPIALAQQSTVSADWSVVQSVSTGDELVVEAKDGTSTKGKLNRVSATEVSLSRGGNIINFPQDKVSKIYRMKGRSRGKSALIGAGIGAGSGAGAGAILHGYEDADIVAIVIPAFAVLGAAIGAGIGAIFGGRKKPVLIYEAR